MQPLLLSTGVIVLSAIGDILAKRYSLGKHWCNAASALFIWSVANYFWIWMLKSGMEMARSWVLIAIPCAAAAIIIGIWYGETLTIKQWVGIALGIAAVWCLS